MSLKQMIPTDYFISAHAHTSAITTLKIQSCAITIKARATEVVGRSNDI